MREAAQEWTAYVAARNAVEAAKAAAANRAEAESGADRAEAESGADRAVKLAV